MHDVSFSPDGRLLAVADTGTVRVWDTTTWTLRRSLRAGGPAGAIAAIGFGLGGRLAASTSTGDVVEWDARTGKQVAVGHQGPGSVSALAFSPDGQRLATADGRGTITLWDPTRLHRVSTLDSDTQSVWSLGFSPDGRTLAAGSSDGSIRVWDLTDRTLTATLTGLGIMHTVAFAPGGKILLSGGSRIIAWDLNPGDMVRQACRTLASDPGLSQAESLVPDASYPRLCPSR